MTVRSPSMTWLLRLGFAMSLAAPVSAQQQQAADPSKEARLAWFRDAKYGLFIHWGLYAIPAGEWKGQTVPGIGEWIMNRAKIPVREYSTLARQFNPVKFDADAWVKLAKDAGMKYIVITSKHHDGFALFKSQASPFNVVDATPFKRDVLKELAAACAKQGIRLGFYYSQSQDWHEPNGAGNGTTLWSSRPAELIVMGSQVRSLRLGEQQVACLVVTASLLHQLFSCRLIFPERRLIVADVAQ